MSETKPVTQDTSGLGPDAAGRKVAYVRARRLGAGVRVLLLGVGIWVTLHTPAAARQTLLVSLGIYTALALLLWGTPGARWMTASLWRGLLLAGLVLDLLFVTWLIYMDGGLGSSLYLLYPL